MQNAGLLDSGNVSLVAGSGVSSAAGGSSLLDSALPSASGQPVSDSGTLRDPDDNSTLGPEFSGQDAGTYESAEGTKVVRLGVLMMSAESLAFSRSFMARTCS